MEPGMTGSEQGFSLMLVTTWLTRAGAETQVKDLACEHARRGAKVIVVCLRDPETFVQELVDTGIEVVSLGMSKGTADPRGVIRLARVVRRFHPDVVHSHMVHANLLSRVTRLFCRMPVLVCTAHNIDEGGRWRERMYRLTDRLADVTTNVSKAGVERYVRVGAAPAGRIRWVPNGIDTSRFERSPAARIALRSVFDVADAFVFLAVGRLERAKGFDVLLQALSLVRTQNDNWVVLIAGDGSQRVKLDAQASSLGLGSEIVRFLGVRNDVPDLMAAADALVLPSRWEGLPMVLLEAASAGLPVVATDVGGNAEVVVDEETGFLVPPDDAEALGRAMVYAATLMPDQRTAMGRSSQRVIEEEYSLMAIVDEWEQLYDEFTHHRSAIAGVR
jgi:glycosyltransferase involved in cell wall biosynthesis